MRVLESYLPIKNLLFSQWLKMQVLQLRIKLVILIGYLFIYYQVFNITYHSAIIIFTT
jgi:hypothetical protein